MDDIDPDLERCLGVRKFAMVRMWLCMVGGSPYWDVCDDGTVCLTWSKGERDVVLLVKPSGLTVLYWDQGRVAPASSTWLTVGLRWMRDGKHRAA